MDLCSDLNSHLNWGLFLSQTKHGLSSNRTKYGLVEARSINLSSEVIDNLIKNSAGVYTEFGENLTSSDLSSLHNLVKRVAVIPNIKKNLQRVMGISAQYYDGSVLSRGI